MIFKIKHWKFFYRLWRQNRLERKKLVEVPDRVRYRTLIEDGT